MHKYKVYHIPTKEVFDVRLIHFGKYILTEEERPRELDWKDCILKRFTGMLDINKEEIYEFDLVSNKDMKTVQWLIKWHQDHFYCGFVANATDGSRLNLSWEHPIYKIGCGLD